ncbi:MAG: galactosyltransferase-related protein [Planctomycetota bacterium]
MKQMNSSPKAAGRKIEYKQIGYGYRRVNPLYGAEYVLDLLLVYKRKRGKKLNVPVRRHVYLQQTFSRPRWREPDGELPVPLLRSRAAASIVERSRRAFLSLLGADDAASEGWQLFAGDAPEGSLALMRAGESSSPARRVFARARHQVVNIIVPLVGRHQTFATFMESLERVVLTRGDPVTLLVVLFRNKDGGDDGALTRQLLASYRARHPDYQLELIQVEADFSRGAALEIGSSHFANDSLLFFCDVDVRFDAQFLRKCRANARRGRRVYYPVLYSEFLPAFGAVKAAWLRGGVLTSAALAWHLNDTLRGEIRPRADHFAIYERAGYWRSYGYGLLCVHQGDFVGSGGFDTTIRGWGLEDVDLMDKFLSAGKLELMRAADPSLVHVYHPSHCDRSLADNQLRMCQASRASAVAHLHDLADAWMVSTYDRRDREELVLEEEEGGDAGGGAERVRGGGEELIVKPEEEEEDDAFR